jgi:hypothetical protein
MYNTTEKEEDKGDRYSITFLEFQSACQQKTRGTVTVPL